MFFLTTVGFPPEASFHGMMVLGYIRAMCAAVSTRRAYLLERETHYSLSPGAQYRWWLSQGGYRP